MPGRDDPLTYEAEMGRPPARLPDDHPDRWQWDYRGSKAERAALAERLELETDFPAVIEGQEEMF